MTVPLALPGDFADLELVAIDILAGVQVNGTPIGPSRVGTRTPAEDAIPFVHVITAIGSGGMNPDAWSETVTFYVACWAHDRPTSRQMRSEVRRLFGQFIDGGEHRGVLIDRAWESSAPGPLPVQDEDDRRVESAWAFRQRRHNGPAIYL